MKPKKNRQRSGTPYKFMLYSNGVLTFFSMGNRFLICFSQKIYPMDGVKYGQGHAEGMRPVFVKNTAKNFFHNERRKTYIAEPLLFNLYGIFVKNTLYISCTKVVQYMYILCTGTIY